MTEIILLCGVPGSGKTSLTKDELADADVVLSRDEEGGRTHELVPKMEAAISQGAKKIVLDATFVTRAHRETFTVAAKKLDIPIHCWFFDTTKEIAQFNICWRMVERYGKVLRTKEDYEEHKDDSNMFPPPVMFAMFKRLEKPQHGTEGFSSVRIIKPEPWKLPKRFAHSAVILDYDGTVRDTKSGRKYPADPKDIEVFPKAATKLQELEKRGVRLMGASNQSGVAKNDPPMDVCQECFEETNRQLGVFIDYDFDYSPAGPAASWHRKPFPGMGIDAIWRHELDPSKVLYVGDRTTDKTFARRCGFNFEFAKDYFDL